MKRIGPLLRYLGTKLLIFVGVSLTLVLWFRMLLWMYGIIF